MRVFSFFRQVKMAVQYMRRVIQKKAKFDIMDLNCLKVCLCLLHLHVEMDPQFAAISLSLPK